MRTLHCPFLEHFERVTSYQKNTPWMIPFYIIYTVYKEVKDHNSVVKIRSEKYFPQDAMNFCFSCSVSLYLILLLSVTRVGLVLFMQMSFGHKKMVFGMINGSAVLLTIVETLSK